MDATARLLSRKGYEATTTRLIAAEVAIQAGSVYHFFPSKDAIVQAVIDEGIDLVRAAVADALDALPAGTPPLQRLTTAIHAHLLASLEHSDYISASIKCSSYLPVDIGRNNRTIRRAYEALWRNLLASIATEGALPDVSHDSILRLLIGGMNWAGKWYRPGKMDLAEISHDFALLMLGQARNC